MNTAITSPSAWPRPTRVRYGVLGLACSLSMITYLDRVCFGTVAPYIRREFSLNEPQKGLLFTAFALAYAAFEVPSGWLGDVFGPRRTLIRIVLWWSLFTALTGLSSRSRRCPGLPSWRCWRCGFCSALARPGRIPNHRTALHNWFPFASAASQGAVWMAGRFAGGMTPLIVLALSHDASRKRASLNSWRHTFWIFGILGVGWCVLVLVVVPRPSRQIRGSTPRS